MGMTGELKVTRLRALALTKRIPFVWLLDSAGARSQEAVGSLFAGSGDLDGDDRRAQGDPAQSAGADQADPVRVAVGLGRRADPGGGRLAVRRERRSRWG